MGAKSAEVINSCTMGTAVNAVRKQAVNIAGAVVVIPAVLYGTFWFLAWMDNTYASDADVKIIQTQQEAQGKKFDTFVYDQKEAKLEEQIETTGDAIFDLERRISRGSPTENDERQLDRLKRRLERYENRLDNLGPSPSSILSTPTE